MVGFRLLRLGAMVRCLDVCGMTPKDSSNTSTFFKITNKDIYTEIVGLREELVEFKLDVKGKLRLNKWLAGTALSLIILVITVMLTHGHT